MFIRHKGGNFYGLLKNHKKFLWYVYQDEHDELLEIKPSWTPIVNERHRVNEINEEFSDVIFIESIFSEVRDELFELGLDLYTPLEDGGWYSVEDNLVKPLIISFENGWMKDNSLYKCYCMLSTIELILDLYPEKIQNYLNQPV